MAQTLTTKLKLAKHDTGDLNWGADANANMDALDQHSQQALLRPPRTLLATLGSGAVGVNLAGSATYFYKVTALNAVGETTEGQIPAVVEAQVSQPATPLPVILQWETVAGATGYKIYKATATGQEQFLAQVTGGAVTTYTDTGGTATTATSVPTSNTARTSVSQIIAGANVTISPPDGTGAVTVNAAGAAAPPNASDSVAGVTELSVAPVLATNPIAVGINDPSVTNGRAPTGAAGGDLSGTFPNPAVAKVNGTAVPATPSAGQVLTATGPTAAAWQAPTGGGYATVVVAAPTGVAATDTANIQNAINGIGNGTVILREGLYVVNTTITIKSRITIRGQGKGEYGAGAPTTLKCDNAMGDVPLFDTFSLAPLDVSLEDFSIDINAFSRAARTGTYDIRLSGVRPRLLRIAIANSSVHINISSNNINEQDSPSIDDCVFVQGKLTAGAWASMQGKIRNCLFVGETATSGLQNALVSFGLATVVTGCVFRTNQDYTTGVIGSTVALDSTASNGRAGTSVHGCIFIQESGTATRAIQVNDGGTGAISIVGNYSATGTNVGSISVHSAGGSGLVTIAGNAGFNGYSGGYQAGNDGQTPINSGGAAGGDLSGTYPNPTVAKVNGVSVPAAPSAGQVLTATGAAAAAWQAPASNWTLVANQNQSSVGQTSPVFSGLSLATHRNYLLSFSILATNAGGAGFIAVLVNGGTPLPQFQISDIQSGVQSFFSGTDLSKAVRITEGGGSVLEICGDILLFNGPNAGSVHYICRYSITDQSAVVGIHCGYACGRLYLGSGVDLTSLALQGDTANVAFAGGTKFSLYAAQ